MMKIRTVANICKYSDKGKVPLDNMVLFFIKSFLPYKKNPFFV